MFKEMRRGAQALSPEDIRTVLDRGSAGVLSLLDENGYTYGVPLSYVRCGETLYFHGALKGAKIDAVRHHSQVSFTVIDHDEVIADEYTTAYRSVILFGRARIVEGADEAARAIRAIGRRYNPAAPESFLEQAVSASAGAFCIIALDIEHASGKRGKFAPSQI